MSYYLNLTKKIKQLEEELAEAQKQTVELLDCLDRIGDINKNARLSFDITKIVRQAFAITNDLSNCILCDAEPVAWSTFDGEGGYDYRSYIDNEDYRDRFRKRNPTYFNWVEPLYKARKER